MKISKRELIDLEACSAGLKRFIKQTSNTEESVKVISLVGMGAVTTCDLLWLAGKKLPKEKIIKFACDCALLNIELIKPYTDKYDLIVEFLNNPTDCDIAADAFIAARDVRAAAASAASDVRVTRGSDAAVYASTNAATYAAYAAVYTHAYVYAVAFDVDYAANTATYATSSGVSKEEINKLLVELFS